MSKSALKKMSHDVEDVLDDAVTALRHASEDLREDAEDHLERAAASLTRVTLELVDEVRARGLEIGRNAVSEVKEHPRTSIAVVAAAIALIGVALGRGRREASS